MRAGVGHREVERCGTRLGSEPDPQLEARERLRSLSQRRALAGGRRAGRVRGYRGRARPHRDPGRLDATLGGVDRDGSGGRHGRESITRACGGSRSLSACGCGADARS